MTFDEEYDQEFDLEDAGYLEDYEEEDSFEEEYERLFGNSSSKTEDEFERDPVTGRRASRSKLSVLNQSSVSGDELDELFLD